MRVLLALGGNAMTNSEGRARPEDQMLPDVADALVSCVVSPGFDFADFELA